MVRRTIRDWMRLTPSWNTCAPRSGGSTPAAANRYRMLTAAGWSARRTRIPATRPHCTREPHGDNLREKTEDTSLRLSGFFGNGT